MKGSDIVVEVARGEGVRHIFGNPGTTELPLMEALSRTRDPGYVLGLQESVVVGMADGYAQVTGRPAMVSLHAMAGLGNALGNLTNARVQGTPLVVTAGQADQRHLVSDPLLAGDLTALAAPVAKWTHEVRRVEDLGTILRRAFRDAASAPTGPVFVSLPTDVLDADDPRERYECVPPVSTVHRSPRASPVEALADLLVHANPARVAIVAGDEVATSDAVEALVQFAEALGVPVYGSSLHANTVFPTTHPLWAGQLGLTSVDLRATLGNYDRVLALGGRVFMVYGYRPGPLVPPGVEVLQITHDPHELARMSPVRLGVLGHVKSTLDELTKAVAGRVDQARVDARLVELGATHEALRQREQADAFDGYPAVPPTPRAAVHALLRSLPVDLAVVDESMTCDTYLRAFHRVTRPGRYFAARGGGLGWGMPAALGVSLAYDREPVLCVVGDGSAMYSPQALWTAAHEGMPVLFAVMNNRQYLMLKSNLRNRHGGSLGEDGFVGMDVDRPAIDFISLARSMGVPAQRIEKASDIADAARAAWDSGRPHLLDLPIAPTDG